MEDAYSDKVMDHFMNPRNVGEIPDASGVGSVGNPTCGDIMKLYIKVEDGVITDAKFKTFGCGAAIATSSMITELIRGKTIEAAKSITNRAVAQALDGLPPRKMHCSVLAEEALASALKDYFARSGLEDGLEERTRDGESTSPPCCEGVDDPPCGRKEK